MLAWGGLLFWGFLGFWLFLIRPKSFVHRVRAVPMTGRRLLFLTLLIGVLIVFLGFLMTLSPIWNGEIPEHRNQYELITESFLKGRLDFEYEVDPRLLELENPYDMEQWDMLGLDIHFDHAFYHGKYYMYFGVVPVFLAFLPFRLITGHALITWHATCLFTAVYLIGLAVYMCWLVKRFFPKLTWGAFTSLYLVIALFSTVYNVKYPSLYQTPVACGMMLEIWSLYFLSRAFLEENEKTDFPLGSALAGSLFGALTFGCRPPLALANILLIPIIIRFLRGKKIASKTVFKLLLAALPYVFVAAGLMWYNYARFENPFEFGQTYQMTVADQSSYSSMFTVENLVRAPVGIFNGLLVAAPMDMLFPYLRRGNGALTLCPLLWLSLSFLIPQSRQLLKKDKLYGISVVLVLTVMLIVAIQIIWSPWLLDRYQSDYIYLLGLGSLCGAGTCFAWVQDKSKLSWRISLIAFGCVLLTALVFLIPFDYNYTGYDENALLNIWNFITLRGMR